MRSFRKDGRRWRRGNYGKIYWTGNSRRQRMDGKAEQIPFLNSFIFSRHSEWSSLEIHSKKIAFLSLSLVFCIKKFKTVYCTAPGNPTHRQCSRSSSWPGPSCSPRVWRPCRWPSWSSRGTAASPPPRGGSRKRPRRRPGQGRRGRRWRGRSRPIEKRNNLSRINTLLKDFIPRITYLKLCIVEPLKNCLGK